ncbi:MAG: hypothetical protein QM725_05625 [Lacibacter sp.]
MNKLPALKADFPVQHHDFYHEFEQWQKENNNHPYQGGIYTLRTSIPVPRALETDPEGILYIGKGIILDVHSRIGNLINSLNNTDMRHEAGVRYNEYNFASLYKINTLRLYIEVMEDAAHEENKRLHSYLKKFGDLPPLNRQM